MKINNQNYYDEHHRKYKNDYLYTKTINALKDVNNHTLLKKFAPNFENYTNDPTNDYMNIYNKMYDNIINSDLTNILDKIFEKKLIPKNNIFFSGFQTYPKLNLQEFLKNDGSFERDIALTKILDLHNKNTEFTKTQNVLTDITKWFNKNRNVGTLFTTSCFEKNDTINSIKISISSRFYNKTANQLGSLAIFRTKKDYELYNLHPENFRSRTLFRKILTNILFGGKFNYDISSDDLGKLHKASKNPMFVDYPFTCKKILSSPDIDKDCIQGFWDGDNSLDEAIINHFIYVYNKNNPSKSIQGCISRDKAYDDVISKTIDVREIVWFNNEDCLEPIGFYLKNKFIFNLYQFYNVMLEYLEKNADKINKNDILTITEDELNKMIDVICNSTILKKLSSRINDGFFMRKFANIQELNNIIKNSNVNDVFDKLDPTNSNIIMRGSNTDIYKNKYLKYKMKYENLKQKN